MNGFEKIFNLDFTAEGKSRFSIDVTLLEQP